jgi:hypothetical protein
VPATNTQPPLLGRVCSGDVGAPFYAHILLRTSPQSGLVISLDVALFLREARPSLGVIVPVRHDAKRIQSKVTAGRVGTLAVPGDLFRRFLTEAI